MELSDQAREDRQASAAPLRVGIAGCGAIAQAVHIPLLARHPQVRVTAVTDTDEDALAAAARRLPTARRCSDLGQLLAEQDSEAVVVCLPSDLHAAAGYQVLGSGRHLYLEKPLAPSLEEGGRVLEAWRRSGRVGMIGFVRRFNPLYVRLRDQLRRGRVGEPVYVRTVFATAPKREPAWKTTRATGGGGLLDLGSHHLDLMRFLLQREVVRVRATILSRRSEHDTALLQLDLAGGPSAHGFFSLAAAETDQVELYGERARLSVSRLTSLDVERVESGTGPAVAARHLLRRLASVRHLAEALRTRRSPFREPGYRVALDRFVDACRGQGAPGGHFPDLADGYACLAVIDAAERSARSGTAEVVRLDHPALRSAEAATRPVLS